jgi:hypothetical protein
VNAPPPIPLEVRPPPGQLDGGAAIASAAASPPPAVLPPAERARRIALGLSIVAVVFSLACGFFARRSWALRDAGMDAVFPSLTAFLVLLLLALLLRMGGAICELFWLERTWSNIPEGLRKVGPVDDVSSGLAIAISFVPGVAWIWKLGLVVGIANGFEAIRSRNAFRAPVPRRLGMAAVIAGWIPGLNVYLAPFLWEMFATRVDACVKEIRGAESGPATSG